MIEIYTNVFERPLLVESMGNSRDKDFKQSRQQVQGSQKRGRQEEGDYIDERIKLKGRKDNERSGRQAMEEDRRR